MKVILKETKNWRSAAKISVLFLLIFLLLVMVLVLREQPGQESQGVPNVSAEAKPTEPEKAIDLEPAPLVLGPRYLKVATVQAIITAYCPCAKCCGQFSDGRTALNDDAYVCDGVAVDPKMIPYRWWVLIPGVGLKEADDTGGAMRQAGKKGIYHLDLRFANHQEALNWGRQKMEIEIYRPQI